MTNTADKQRKWREKFEMVIKYYRLAIIIRERQFFCTLAYLIYALSMYSLDTLLEEKKGLSNYSYLGRWIGNPVRSQQRIFRMLKR